MKALIAAVQAAPQEEAPLLALLPLVQPERGDASVHVSGFDTSSGEYGPWNRPAEADPEGTMQEEGETALSPVWRGRVDVYRTALMAPPIDVQIVLKEIRETRAAA